MVIQPDIPLTGIEGGIARLDRGDVEQLNHELGCNGWRIESVHPSNRGAMLVVLVEERP